MLFVPFSEKNVTKSKRSNTAHTKWNDSRTYERYTSTKSNIKQNKALHDYVHQCIPLGELQHVFKHMSESDISQRLRHATRVPIPRDAHSAFPKIEDQTSRKIGLRLFFKDVLRQGRVLILSRDLHVSSNTFSLTHTDWLFPRVGREDHRQMGRKGNESEYWERTQAVRQKGDQSPEKLPRHSDCNCPILL